MDPISEHSPKKETDSFKKNSTEHDGDSDSIDTSKKVYTLSQFQDSYRKVSHISILLSVMIGIALFILVIFFGTKLYQKDDLFFSHEKPFETAHRIPSPETNELAADTGKIEVTHQKNILESIQKPIELTDSKQNDLNNAHIKEILTEISSLKNILLTLNQSHIDLSARLNKTEELIKNPLKDPNIQRMISLLILKHTIDQGENILLNKKMIDELSILEPCTAVLMNFSNTRIPTTLEILAQFPKVAEDMLSASEYPNQDSSIFDYFIFQMSKLVRIRSTGDIQGETPAAIIARIEYNLKNGQLKQASLEWDKIPEKAKKPGVFLRNALNAHICSDKIIKEELDKIS
ncbi:MAG: hypothetical protein EU981_04490 [Candidatus Liberibacter ctenarytainae]|uniref:Transmembrane protein n=1 Tax=Candidatus Liberibacter ctenarytainae TaxID=2020335 RepID=A0A937DMA1_9HYPH|nr:hypothetical protein [Candidatus Liberibacter ctenarytainae]